MKNYELTCLLSPELNEASLETEEKKLDEIVKTSSLEKAKKVTLSYPIKKQTGAFLYVREFETEEAKEIEKKLDEETNILRFLLIKKLKEEKKEDFLMKPEKKLKEEKKEEKIDENKIEEELNKVLEE